MPIRSVPGFNLEYFLVVFDQNGRERREPDNSLLSEEVFQRVKNSTPSITDVFFMSHGWKGDVPAAIEQYDAWVKTMAELTQDLDAARKRRPGFAPLAIGLHWPSLPWGDETISTGGGALLSAADQTPIEVQVEAYAARIADSDKARIALQSILRAARDNPGATTLSPELRDAYAILFSESGLGSGDASGRPGSDQEGFDPDRIIADVYASATQTDPSTKKPMVLGIGESLQNAILMPLRQLSFWKMKDRARRFGESGAHALLMRLQQASTTARFHLMGHSFGCIVVSAAVAGDAEAPQLPRPVDSLFLVQGAVSLWSYADDIPYAAGTAGYFNRIRKDRLVRGPIVTTRSEHDTAVGHIYPIGAGLKQQLVLGSQYPAYGGIGAFGIQGLRETAEDLLILPIATTYQFRGGRVYNLDASDIIKNGSGLSGAHSDISHAEVAHAFWQAALTPLYRPVLSGELNVLLGLGRDTHDPLILGDKTLGGIAGPSTPTGEPPLPIVPRWLNAEVEDHAPDKPLVIGQWYALAFDIDLAKHGVGSGIFKDGQLFPKGTDEVQLTVQLDSADFDISDRTRPLRVPRVGRSHGKARFDISPRHNGSSTITATIHKDGNFIQQMQLTFDVGAISATSVQMTPRGRPVAAAGVLHPRDLGLSIWPASGGGYDCVVWGPVLARARLPVDQAFLASAIDAARHDLMKVVMQRNTAGDYVFQTSIDIPDADRDVALRTLARAGALLFQKMFFGPAAAADSKAVGEYLRKMSSDQAARLKLQILAEHVPVPWGLLYVGDVSRGAQLNWDNFLGMRHIIEQIPLQNTLSVCDPGIPSDKPQLAVSVNVNNGIDVQMGFNFVAQQQAFWADAKTLRKRVQVTSRTTIAEVMEALARQTTDDQILYFYCHAHSTGLTAPGGPDASCLVLTDGSITLGDLSLDAPSTIPLRGNPLVFINACESAEMSPAFYDGFVPYFMAKGARGVIGTECETPALFAMSWAKRFFERFLDGDPLGDAFLGLRQEFLDKHGNPLGLLYAVHCDGDTQIAPALPGQKM